MTVQRHNPWAQPRAAVDVREEGVPDEQIPSFSGYGLRLAWQVLHERLTVAIDVGPKARVEALKLAVESW